MYLSAGGEHNGRQGLPPETPGTRESRHVVVGIEPFERYRALAAGCVHELPLPHVDADVIDLAALRAEEHQIAGRELGDVDGPRRAELLRGGAGHFDARAVVHVKHQAAAIETFGSGAAVAI